MADYVFAEQLGKVGYYVDRVLSNDGANSALVAVPMASSGTAEQAESLTTLAGVEANANFAEQTHASWGRKTLDDAGDGLAYALDAPNNRKEADFSDLVWAAPATGNNTTGLVICFDPDTTAGDDSTLIPLVHLDFPIAADGSQVTYEVNAEGWYHATRA